LNAIVPLEVADTPTRQQRYRRRQMTTDDSKQNSTDPLGGPVISYIITR